MTKRFNFGSAILAGIIATIIMTIVMIFFGINIMQILGMAAGMSGSSMYFVGGLIHLIIGIIYALIYAWIFEPLFKGMPKFLSGAIYSLLPFIIAMLFMGPFMKSIHSVFHSSKGKGMCTQMQCDGSPYTSRYSKRMAPCAENSSCASCCSDESPYEARYSKRMAPCSENGCCMSCCSQVAEEYCNGCMASDASKANMQPTKMFLPIWLVSLINHLVYGVFLGITYRPKAAA